MAGRAASRSPEMLKSPQKKMTEKVTRIEQRRIKKIVIIVLLAHFDAVHLSFPFLARMVLS